jgi:hypothetical protein
MTQALEKHKRISRAPTRLVKARFVDTAKDAFL